MLKLVVLTGSGISAESGIKTFRDSGGLWEEYDVMEVASIEGWRQNPDRLLDFYNQRRKQLKDAQPNNGHAGLVKLEAFFDVHIITQNIDNLHERAGSKNVLHLHGELTKAQSSKDPSEVTDIGYDEIHPGDLCSKGSQLRPHVVWFGEPVPAMEEAVRLTMNADIYVVIGSSLNVYPAAGLVQYVPQNVPIYVIDPKDINILELSNVHFIKEQAGKGVEILIKTLKEKYL